ncbi:hypothetical protein DFP73DRAFT_544399 [Morchella snyderi]|nr:hypothetical protein DFP73DRAFT_544399 [Morchella snyderi]
MLPSRMLLFSTSPKRFPRPKSSRLPNIHHLTTRNHSSMKDKATIIDEFNGLVNMSSGELSEWLEEDASIFSGWTKDGTGETVGHQSGRHIVNILENNPDRVPEKYRDEDIDHMRKVVSYCKRHLAQEEQAKKNTNSKSYKSLKNWGHDALKE